MSKMYYILQISFLDCFFFVSTLKADVRFATDNFLILLQYI